MGDPVSVDSDLLALRTVAISRAMALETAIYAYIYIYVYIEKATASAADLRDPRLGCLEAWMIVFLLA